MTNQEAISILRNTFEGRPTDCLSRSNEALCIAIDAIREQRTVLYICDQTKCEDCSAAQGLCYYTTDINHAANFIQAENGIFMESEVLRTLNNEESN